MKPTSYIIKTMFIRCALVTKNKESAYENAGALIGMLQRYFILVLIMIGQYTAIGFVLTAKSIARYKRISDDIQFSEYYLLGTMLSLVIVMTTYMLLFKL